MQKLFPLFFLFLSFVTFSQREFPDYHPPLPIPMILAGNFGELRPNHFHMGIDLKTQGREGFSLSSISDGFVSRVKVSTYGYGKAVYIDHPDGHTSVYAHCSRFVGRLDSLVRVGQYRTQNYEVELFFQANEVPLKKGEVFALSGNTGGSTAPHLHFEVRDTKTEAAKNPLVYAFDVADTRKPEIRKVKVFAVNEQGYVVPGRAKDVNVEHVSGTYRLRGDTLRIPASFCSSFGGVGLAFDVIDRLNGAENRCGLYGTHLIVDGDTIFGQLTNQISFDNSRYINSHRDLSAMNSHYHKSFRTVSNPLEIYINDNLGVISMQPGTSKQVKYVTFDPKGNQSILSFVLQVEDGEISENYNPSTETHWYPENSFHVQHPTWEVIADSFSIYEPYPIRSSKNAHLCDVHTSMQKKATVRMKLDNPTLPVEKYYLEVTAKNGSKRAQRTTYVDGWLEAKTNHTGAISIQSDQVAPTIRPITKGLIYRNSRVKFTVSETGSGLADYDLFIDGQWHLMEYEYKGNLLFFDLTKEMNGQHIFRIEAKDECGNVSVWEQTITVAIP